jgi:hypothetical protein
MNGAINGLSSPPIPVRCHSHAIKPTLIVLLELLITGRSTAPKKNFQQAYEASLADGGVLMALLKQPVVALRRKRFRAVNPPAVLPNGAFDRRPVG